MDHLEGHRNELSSLEFWFFTLLTTKLTLVLAAITVLVLESLVAAKLTLSSTIFDTSIVVWLEEASRTVCEHFRL